jgi:hypothetical protein
VIVALLAILAVVAVSSRAMDRLRLAQAESILGRMSDGEARAYHAELMRRLRRVMVMRALVVLSLLCLFYVFRDRLTAARPPAPAPRPPAAAGAG